MPAFWVSPWDCAHSGEREQRFRPKVNSDFSTHRDIGFLDYLFIIGQLTECLSHRFALECQAVRVVHEPVENGIGQGVDRSVVD